MKLACRDAPNQWPSLDRLFLAVQSADYYTETQIHTSSSSSYRSASSRDSLYNRMLHIEPSDSVVPILDQWRQQGRGATTVDLGRIIKLFRKHRRFSHALQVSEWMIDNFHPDCSTQNLAIRLDLISKVHGLKHAENYFDNIPDYKRDMYVYGALLNCYAHKKSLEQAEVVMQKLRELGFACNPLPYNTMMNLYYKMGKYEKLDKLMQEMENNHIKCDGYTYSIRVNAYVAASDVDGLDKLMKKIESIPESSIDWHVFVAAASGYVKAGLKDKATTTLKAAEKRMTGNARADYDILLCIYAGIENKDEVYRIWDLFKKTGKVYNKTYHAMIHSLLKFGDMLSAEKILEEWESTHLYFDGRIPNAMISAYCKNGMLQKAVACVDRLIESGKKLPASTWGRLATGYCREKQMESAVETMRNAFLASHPGWRPDQDTVAACVGYLKVKDEEKASEFVELTKIHCHQSSVGENTEEAEHDKRQKLDLRSWFRWI